MLWQLMSLFLIQNVYYGISLTYVRAESRELRVMGWVNFAFCMILNYYQLSTLVEVDPKVLNVSGLVISAIFFLFIAITFGQTNLFCLKLLLINMKQSQANSKNIE